LIIGELMKRRLAEFELVKLLDKGALSQIYLAEHSLMKKQYVLKVLSSKLLEDRSFCTLFEESISLAAQLQHPSIAQIHQVAKLHGDVDSLCSVDGCYYLVSDYFPSMPLHNYLEEAKEAIVNENTDLKSDINDSVNYLTLDQYIGIRGKDFTEEYIYQILIQIAAALDYAHSKKNSNQLPLAHLGLKLSNILVTGSLQNPKFILTDFGIYGALDKKRRLELLTTNSMLKELPENCFSNDGSNRSSNHDNSAEEGLISDSTNSMIQNYAFLAPEQKRLKSDQLIGPEADVYAFGVLAFYLLVGEFPEGVFELPSLQREELDYQWDRLIMACLSSRTYKRPKNLVESLKAIKMNPSTGHDFYKNKLNLLPSHLQKNIETSIHGASSNEQAVQESDQNRSFVNHESKIVVAKPSMIQIAATQAQIRLAQKNNDLVSSSIPLTSIKESPSIKSQELNFSNKEVLHENSDNSSDYDESSDEKKLVLTPMRSISGGKYTRGSNEGSRDEMPCHAIVITGFSLEIHPVMNEQFVQFLRAIGSEKDLHNNDIIRLKESRIKRVGGKLLIEPGYQKHPVVGITWYGAQAYCEWVGRRLPTEAEWEIAARGGIEDAIYPTGENIEKFQANFFNNDTTAVMSYPPNDYGFYDMAGNVYDWCQDWYAYNTYELTANEPMFPQGPPQGVYRVLRGGCWKSLKDDLRCSHRHRNNPGAVNRTYGFRCAMTITN
jgi:formylglycine-generating enzyme required for sulfatase activity